MEYLAELGISHLYASPIFNSVPDSTHGYNITDFSGIRQEIGGENEFRELNSLFRRRSVGWIQDFVPNHMAMHPLNHYLYDVLKFGSSSKYANFFDIDWNHPIVGKGKLLLPILSNSYPEELHSGRFTFSDGDDPSIHYGSLTFPVTIPDESGGDELTDKPEIDPALLDRILSHQHYSFGSWKSSRREINYRRFLNVNGLICLKEEDDFTFTEVHRKLVELVREDLFDGFRLDHVDGLYDPEDYMNRLRKLIEEKYVVMEKILQQGEQLSPYWKADGTTGYDFLSCANAVFCSDTGLQQLENVYREFIDEDSTVIRDIHEIKNRVINDLYLGDMDNIVRQIFGLFSSTDNLDISPESLREAIKEILSEMPVYRTYVGIHDHPDDLSSLDSAIDNASKRRTDLVKELNLLRTLVEECRSDQGKLAAVRRLQQFMPAVFVKSIEDRVFFTFNRLISLNEIGFNPYSPQASVDAFHRFNSQRLDSFPVSLSALSTHDTKFSEDIRARINVISELSSEWRELVSTWSGMNEPYRSNVSGKPCPSANEEYYIYQLLVGSYPFHREEESYQDRLMQHLQKSIREAYVNTSWIDPDQRYEKQYMEFMTGLLNHEQNPEFWTSFLKFGSTVSFHGGLNSIGQKILQMTSPGVPDTYQGTEVWSYNFVDPDNRRNIDFARLSQMLQEIRNGEVSFEYLIDLYPDDLSSGYLKLLVTRECLKLRKSHPDLFLKGSYTPVDVTGEHRENLIAFLRREGRYSLLVLVPRLTSDLGVQRLPIGVDAWKDTAITIPSSEGLVFRDIFSHRVVDLTGKKQILVSSILEKSPFSILFHDGNNPG